MSQEHIEHEPPAPSEIPSGPQETQVATNPIGNTIHHYLNENAPSKFKDLFQLVIFTIFGLLNAANRKPTWIYIAQGQEELYEEPEKIMWEAFETLTYFLLGFLLTRELVKDFKEPNRKVDALIGSNALPQYTSKAVKLLFSIGAATAINIQKGPTEAIIGTNAMIPLIYSTATSLTDIGTRLYKKYLGSLQEQALQTLLVPFEHRIDKLTANFTSEGIQQGLEPKTLTTGTPLLTALVSAGEKISYTPPSLSRRFLLKGLPNTLGFLLTGLMEFSEIAISGITPKKAAYMGEALVYFMAICPIAARLFEDLIGMLTCNGEASLARRLSPRAMNFSLIIAGGMALASVVLSGKVTLNPLLHAHDTSEKGLGIALWIVTSTRALIFWQLNKELSEKAVEALAIRFGARATREIATSSTVIRNAMGLVAKNIKPKAFANSFLALPEAQQTTFLSITRGVNQRPVDTLALLQRMRLPKPPKPKKEKPEEVTLLIPKDSDTVKRTCTPLTLEQLKALWCCSFGSADSPNPGKPTIQEVQEDGYQP